MPKFIGLDANKKTKMLLIPVRRLLPIFSLFMLTVWLSASEHCALGATGLIPQTGQGSCSLGQRNCTDGCSVIEGANFKPSFQVLKVLPPELLACVCHLCLHVIPLDAVRVIAPISAGAFDSPQYWVTTWHFARRASPLPGAPSLFLA